MLCQIELRPPRARRGRGEGSLPEALIGFVDALTRECLARACWRAVGPLS
jgi:hypothetical protein